MQRPAGYTLWELICTLGIGAIVLTGAVPAFSGWLLDARLTADVNAFVLAVQLARSEAAKRGTPVIVCRSSDRERCDSSDVSAGWIVFGNTDGIDPPTRSPSEPLLYAHVPEVEGAITANRPFFEFWPGRRRSTNGTVVFCDERGSGAARAVVVSYTGRPRVSKLDADGRPLRCASLT